MEATLKWYEKDPLSKSELERLIRENNYRNMYEISPHNPEQSQHIQIGNKIAVLSNNGIVAYYTITELANRDGLFIVGRDETGTEERGKEFALDSSMGWCFNCGYKVLEKFPWE
ncbi:MAG: hypothetical protein RL557_49 [archaeon]|jgi:hypothetical protein